MTTIGRLQQALIDLSARLRTEKSGKSGRSTRTATPATAQPSSEDLPLEVEIGRRLEGLDPNAGDLPRRLRLAFLETALTREFGDAPAMDPQFSVLVEQVSDALEQDRQLIDELDTLLRDLVQKRRA